MVEPKVTKASPKLAMGQEILVEATYSNGIHILLKILGKLEPKPPVLALI